MSFRDGNHTVYGILYAPSLWRLTTYGWRSIPLIDPR